MDGNQQSPEDFNVFKEARSVLSERDLVFLRNPANKVLIQSKTPCFWVKHLEKQSGASGRGNRLWFFLETDKEAFDEVLVSLEISPLNIFVGAESRQRDSFMSFTLSSFRQNSK